MAYSYDTLFAEAVESATVQTSVPEGLAGGNGKIYGMVLQAESDTGLDAICYNEIEQRPYVRGKLPWSKAEENRAWEPADDSHFRAYMQQKYNAKGKSDLADAFMIVANGRRYDPLVEMIEGLPEWDGEKRVDKLAIDFIGAEDTPYSHACMRLAMNGAMMRAFYPGCKFDTMLVFEGVQGGRKSSFVRALALDDGFFTDNIGNIGKKEASECIQGKWIVEVGELASFKKSEVEQVKLFVSQQADNYRVPYEKYASPKKRRCIFIGTTNSKSFLADATGARRFLPVHCEPGNATRDIFAESAHDYILQAWAEIYEEFKEDGKLPLVLPESVYADAIEAQQGYSAVDVNTGTILNHVEVCCRPGERICILQIMDKVFGISREEASQPRHKAFQNEIAAILDNKIPGLVRLKGRPKHSDYYGQQTCWEYRPNTQGGTL